MIKKALQISIIIGLLVLLNDCNIFAQDGSTEVVKTKGMQDQKVFGAVGNVEYVNFKPRGESTFVLKDKKGETVEISLKDLRDGTTVLATYRKEAGEKDKEKNVLISLSIVKSAEKH